ncbi:MAG: adenylate kinase [Pirellulales bacterium]
MRIIFIGPPGVGKGTQSQRLLKYFGIPHVSTGDLLREAISESTRLGRLAQRYMTRGQLVPDPIVLQIVGARLEEGDCQNGCLFDGFPRTLGQAQALDEFLAEMGAPLDAVIELKVDEDEVVRRLAQRQRGDDTPEIIRRRMHSYWQETAPLLDYYQRRNILYSIDGVGTPDEVFGRIKAALDARGPKPADA